MAEWISSQPDWLVWAGIVVVLLLGGILGRMTKKTLALGGTTKHLRRIADALEKKHGP